MNRTSPSGFLISSPATSVSTPSSHVVMSPCAACKTLRRKCADKCLSAPYFPPTDPLKFTTVHRIFGTSNIIKLLQDLPEYERADAVNSMVYEANARVRDPVYGCTGLICQLQKQVIELQAQLAMAQSEVVTMQCEQPNLDALICSEMAQQSRSTTTTPQSFQSNPNYHNNQG
ncbi:LOB domain-containing protein 1-like [Cornus florida]|uniref:LOB domain-containing protein 1-like n=1 Tax=Cornus florida TaxID=4283 RepID=UPI0028965D80|nr:LOB domain-containing protein 1-like [Cornus florida]